MIIDRFEENIAVVELNGEMLNAPRALFCEAKEGDVVELTVLPRKTVNDDGAAESNTAPAGSTDDTAAKAEQFKAATMRMFGLDQPKTEEASDDEPAAMFQKLRSKKKKRK